MFGPTLAAWEAHNVGYARFDVSDDGDLVLEHLDSATGLIKLNPVWLKAQGFGHHVESDGAIIRVGEHVFRRVRQLAEPFAAYQVDEAALDL